MKIPQFVRLFCAQVGLPDWAHSKGSVGGDLSVAGAITAESVSGVVGAIASDQASFSVAQVAVCTAVVCSADDVEVEISAGFVVGAQIVVRSSGTGFSITAPTYSLYNAEGALVSEIVGTSSVCLLVCTESGVLHQLR